MSGQESKIEKVKESRDESKAKPQQASKEANAAMPDLIKAKQALLQFYKEGGKSGISNDFGKPTFVDSSADKSPQPKEFQVHLTDTVEEKSTPKADTGGERPSQKEDIDVRVERVKNEDSQPARLIDKLKSLGRTGITNDFGKLTLYDEVEKQPAGKNLYELADKVNAPEEVAQKTTNDSHQAWKDGANPAIRESPASWLGDIKDISQCNGRLIMNGKVCQIENGTVTLPDGTVGHLQDGGTVVDDKGRMIEDLNKKNCVLRLEDTSGHEHNILCSGGHEINLDLAKANAQKELEQAQNAYDAFQKLREKVSDYCGKNAMSDFLAGEDTGKVAAERLKDAQDRAKKLNGFIDQAENGQDVPQYLDDRIQHESLRMNIDAAGDKCMINTESFMNEAGHLDVKIAMTCMLLYLQGSELIGQQGMLALNTAMSGVGGWHEGQNPWKTLLNCITPYLGDKAGEVAGDSIGDMLGQTLSKDWGEIAGNFKLDPESANDLRNLFRQITNEHGDTITILGGKGADKLVDGLSDWIKKLIPKESSEKEKH